MATLITYAGPVDARSPVTRIGGVPLVPAGFRWPCCETCAGPMQFLAQVLLRDVASSPNGEGPDVLSIFMCQNDPGLCDDWDPTSGGNRALLFPLGGLGAAAVPAQGEVLPEASGIDHVMIEGDSYEEACGTWSTTRGRPQSEVLGGLGGSPSWLQNDETPSCPACARAMASWRISKRATTTAPR